MSVQRMDVMYYRFNSSPLKGRLECAAFPRHLAISLWLYVPDQQTMLQTGRSADVRFSLKLDGLTPAGQLGDITLVKANAQEYAFVSSAHARTAQNEIIFETQVELKAGTFNGFSILYAPPWRTPGRSRPIARPS